MRKKSAVKSDIPFHEMGRSVIQTELEGLQQIADKIDHHFDRACEILLACQGRIVVMGVGKSGHVGSKIAATFASTGSPAFFVHPAEACHGDLGMITKSDVVLAISYSGETREMLDILPLIQRLNIPLITLTGNINSTLAKQADVNIDVGMIQEACPFNLAPTTSTTVSLVLGDALAMTLLKTRGFTEEDFALRHPGGSLGQRLFRHIKKVIYAGGSEQEVVSDGTALKEDFLRVAIVAGEYSGDTLGADLIHALREKHPDLVVYGIAGPKMVTAGCHAIYPTERLAVLGIIEPIRHLPALLNIRRQLRRRILRDRPDVFIGIDSPEFNLGLEVALKKEGIPVVHYVGPTIWAWRPERIHTIKRAVDLMLVLFPFEVNIYRQHSVPVRCVGHPLADQIPVKVDKKSAKERLGLSASCPVLAILPGSRRMEIRKLGKIFIKTAKLCVADLSDLQIVTSMINTERAKQFKKILKKVSPDFSIKILEGASHQVLEASDVVLAASGTVTLEAMLFKCPMVVAYKLSALSFFILRHLVKVSHIALPNLLAQRRLVPEFLQAQVNPKMLSRAVLEQLKDDSKRQALEKTFTEIHQELKKDASHQASEAILALVKG